MLEVTFSTLSTASTNLSADMAFGPTIRFSAPGNFKYYKMVGKDSGALSVTYVSWTVPDEPDYNAIYAPSTLGTIVDIYVSYVKIVDVTL